MKTVVLGRNESTLLSVIRSVGMGGHEVYCVNTRLSGTPGFPRVLYGNELIPFKSRYLKKGVYCASEGNEDALLDTILGMIPSDGEKAVLIPTDDKTAVFVNKYSDTLKQTFLIPGLRSFDGDFSKLMKKDVQKGIARECGLPVAEGEVIRVENGKYEIPDSVSFPCITKGNFLGKKMFIRKCDDCQALDDTLRFIAENGDFDILIERYMRIDKEYATVGVSDGDNVEIPGMILTKRIGKGPLKGVAMLGEVLPPDAFDELFDKLKRFVRNVGFCGLFDFDLYESDGTVYFSEFNARIGGSGYAFTANGANLPAAWVDAMASPEKTVRHVELRSCCHFFNERVFISDYVAGLISYKEGRRLRKQAEVKMFESKDDRAPYAQYRRSCIYSRLYRGIHKMTGH